MTTGNFLSDTPELYEQRFPDPGHLAARWTDDVLRRYAAGPRVLDIGCGTGRDAAWLHHESGREVVGIDTSETMLAHARTHHPGPDYRIADMRDFDLGRGFDAAVCLDSALLYCHTNEELTAFLACCRRHLAPGGLLIAEMRNGAFFLGSTELLDGPRVNTVARHGVTHTSRTTLWIDHAAQLLRRRRVWTADDGSPPQEQRSAWRLLFPQELRYFLAAAGFEVLALYDRPGPRTEPPWSQGAAPAESASSDRLHVIARLMPRHSNAHSQPLSQTHGHTLSTAHSNGDSTS
ncbi:SAM-dependent methyltransferase [Streptomyces lunaelactis]|uniref:SAM-dependent methyltransferase n=1 Tax=Streptomyces lunaelactis TaxID=1535768 RepID=A0A2R4SXB7_9ACTN|nr:class I SAM-dependent methyltransferase [Streptomyces lunaelactis]AVZ71521.1 SAM-dependent methyltransferase [Streptomyces lunaelactis]NUK84897.1 class I SAM-dependent methyltransferase [Streptomyces lunaelactis]